MAVYTDQMQRLVEVPGKIRRIVSLVPSQTELLCSLGLEEEVVGITKFCVHPAHWRKEKTIIGGTKHFHLDRIRKLQPDLIIGNKEENYQEGIETLEKEFPVWMSDIYTLEDALQMSRSIGEISGRVDKSRRIIAQIGEGFKHLLPLPEISCLYFIWRKPYMAVGGQTFINEVMQLCGFRNSLAEQSRYPELSAEEIRELNPRLILLSSEPYPFKEKHLEEIQNLCPEAEVLLIDGEMFSWYGSRLCKAVPYLQDLQREIRLRLKL